MIYTIQPSSTSRGTAGNQHFLNVAMLVDAKNKRLCNTQT